MLAIALYPTIALSSGQKPYPEAGIITRNGTTRVTT